MVKEILHIALFNFLQWKRNPRVIVTFLLAFVMCVMLTENSVSFAYQFQSTMQWMEAFVWTFGDPGSIMLSSLLLLLLFADIPFISAFTPYYLIRTKKSRWLCGQITYVVVTIIIFMFFILFTTMVISAPISFKGNIWSETGALIGYSGVGNNLSLPVSIKTMEMSFPYQTAIQVFLLMLLYNLFLVSILLVANLRYEKRKGIITVFIVNLFGLLLNPSLIQYFLKIPDSLIYKARNITGWLSPLNHATYSMHNFGYDFLPRLWMSQLIFLISVVLLLFISYKSLGKYNFSQENDRN